MAWLASYLTGVNVSRASYQAALRAGLDPSSTLTFMMSNCMAFVMGQLQCYALPPNLWRVQYNDSQAQFRDGNLVAKLWWYDPHDETEFRDRLLSHLSWGHSQRDSPFLSMLDDRNEAVEWGKARYRWYDREVQVSARAKVYRINCRLLSGSMVFRLSDLLQRFNIWPGRDTSHEYLILNQVPASSLQSDVEIGSLIEQGGSTRSSNSYKSLWCN